VEHVPANDSYHGFTVVKVHEAYAATRQIAVVVDSALLSGFDSALLKGLLEVRRDLGRVDGPTSASSFAFIGVCFFGVLLDHAEVTD